MTMLGDMLSGYHLRSLLTWDLKFWRIHFILRASCSPTTICSSIWTLFYTHTLSLSPLLYPRQNSVLLEMLNLKYINISSHWNIFSYRYHHHHHVVPPARISLTLSRHFSLSFIASGRSSGLHPVSSHSCCM